MSWLSQPITWLLQKPSLPTNHLAGTSKQNETAIKVQHKDLNSTYKKQLTYTNITKASGTTAWFRYVLCHLSRKVHRTYTLPGPTQSYYVATYSQDHNTINITVLILFTVIQWCINNFYWENKKRTDVTERAERHWQTTEMTVKYHGNVRRISQTRHQIVKHDLTRWCD